MERDINDIATTYRVDFDGFKAGFVAGAASIGAGIKAFFGGWW
jgi:hypothetical protein